MSQHPTGPRPQRHEIVEALDALVEDLAAVLPIAGDALKFFRPQLHTAGLRLLDRLGVDTASVRVTAGHAPHLTVPAPPHDTEL